MPHVDLLELPYFEGISIEGLVSLVDLMTPAQYEPGDVILREGTRGPHPLYIATTGRVLIKKRAPDGKERILADPSSPTLFGEIELFCQVPAVCSAVAATRVSCFTLDRPTFDRLVQAQNTALSRFVFNVARVACHRLAVADEMLAQVLTNDDLCQLRRTVWARMNENDDGAHTTGVFSRPGVVA